jgi:hypothetical protein
LRQLLELLVGKTGSREFVYKPVKSEDRRIRPKHWIDYDLVVPRQQCQQFRDLRAFAQQTWKAIDDVPPVSESLEDTFCALRFKVRGYGRSFHRSYPEMPQLTFSSGDMQSAAPSQKLHSRRLR